MTNLDVFPIYYDTNANKPQLQLLAPKVQTKTFPLTSSMTKSEIFTNISDSPATIQANWVYDYTSQEFYRNLATNDTQIIIPPHHSYCIIDSTTFKPTEGNQTWEYQFSNKPYWYATTGLQQSYKINWNMLSYIM